MISALTRATPSDAEIIARIHTRATATATEQPRCGRSGELPGCV